MNIQALPMHRFLDYEGNVQSPLPSWASGERLVQFYRDMLITRAYDNKAVALQRTGKLGTYPSHLGSEAFGVGIGHALKPSDVFIPYYRDMPAMWVRGIGMEKNLQYWGGDERGSDFCPEESHLHCADLPFCVPIATQCTHAVGVASALKIQGNHDAALVTCGDGATSKGDFLESINCAGVWHLPLVFVVNNNQWAISVPRQLQCAADLLSEKAKGAGIPGITVDGNDVVAVYDAVSNALGRARKGKGATLIEAISYRLSDHTTADDASRYRSADELKQAWQYEPIKRLQAYLTAQGLWNEELEQQWLAHCKQQVEQAVAHYLSLPPQAPESAFDYLYASLPTELHAQRDMLINKVMRMQGGKHG
ncbi:pyruvate dehydrogenase (acetyl-transferring) E1 component subunit alpha [Vibrio vulnificus]|uniref:pyruvate dehydrogenase (acetyl-transferring) E1 component subunit alpha n=1 Tax=Vibrio vulnificus TaxID=672 RepID=UPI0002DA0252|nr:pyruvate dehydrogenase (acetyl-transferring) E1 component subunit alpha [Vibrio vulnificus]ASM98752.1 pyruvate dehydrogenase (acetyl-transferring) E1 component subunit alpha [Vibrio vulnificus NBRC 15645 = ATCC 27562]EHW0635559.1 pyruvate dehydrogenase (acetyl-transferring) E1 component subunit alpha [Vibrio vulnificus]EIU7551829.1 pyruvate dehydrogenase (acetyl-transferring) E1 component subunit alpha [Vibrio vulnificus]MCL7016946.1 pyruvate dehydrogenase (acetyl-transferring) E1 component 